ncbi:CLUMA_CG017478, isoform A [Clunio marinus]|uniref:E3 ubiquitin-protein ligase n=1 Tax=Clunio marinus TaxID=568069 RepID=A0A1J1IVU0_9DIPT|nr:CLUMA_CG017478, isoform A [Clunio marinus]
MSSNCVVVVWEVESTSLKKYIPYSPSVSQNLERAFAKKLTQVFLGDSDASLSDFYVNLRTMKQCSEKNNTEFPFLNVRRQFYSPSSPPGKGIKWEHAGNLNNEWHQYDIEIQCLIEDAWSNGNQQIDISASYIQMPYIIDFCNMIQTRKPSGPIKQIRRVTQAVYPLTKLQSAINQQSTLVSNANKFNQLPPKCAINNTNRMSINSNRRSIKSNYLQHQQMLSTSAPKLNNFNDTTSQTGSTKSAPAPITQNQYSSVIGIPPSGKKSSKSSKPSKNVHDTITTSPTNLARQILNNLNIFSHHHHHNHYEKGEPSSSSTSTYKKGFILSHNGSHKSKKSLCKNSHGSTSMLDLETSSINSRRPSVDTISTYLSNGSKGSRGGSVRGKPSYGSVSDLLNCSLSSENDEVFLSSHSSLSSSMSMNMIIKGSIVGIDSNSEQISRFVSVVDPPQSKPCPICLDELHRENSAKNPTVSLSRCQHLMHLNCLNELILSQKNDLQKSLYIECPTCGIIYGEKRGNQPPGTMSWITIPKSLPGHEDCNTIQIIYNIASGVQNEHHPNPGRAFFAVGFPRLCYLPENPTGRKILRFLKIGFDRGLLFSIGRSATTGREDVVIWKNVEHKTQFSMYPDPTYLQRCMEQLVHLGVTD